MFGFAKQKDLDDLKETVNRHRVDYHKVCTELYNFKQCTSGNHDYEAVSSLSPHSTKDSLRCKHCLKDLPYNNYANYRMVQLAKLNQSEQEPAKKKK